MDTDEHSSQTNRALLYGSIATAVVSLLSLSGACVIPLLTGRAKHRWMHFFVAMAISTLSSDAILHIVPQLLGAHSHNDHHTAVKSESNETRSSDLQILSTQDHAHDHDSNHDHGHHIVNSSQEDQKHQEHGKGHCLEVNEDRMILLRLSAVMLTIYLIYLIEFVLYYRKKQKCTVQISRPPIQANITHCNETVVNHAWEEEPTCGVISDETLATGSSVSQVVSSSEEFSDDDDPVLCCGLKGRAIVILFGDGVHNFVDGIAMGASFLHSMKLGIITSIAVICHELPHELGDLAVLIESGLSMKLALGLNLLSALTAFLGLFTSIAIGESTEMQHWLLAITAGMFLYVAWIDMLAHLKHDGSHKDRWPFACFLQYSGFSVGFVIIFALGWFEKELFSSD